jgi:glycerophosphoryl diester phosphodiesterase
MQKPQAIHPFLSPDLPRIFAHRGFAGSDGVSENTVEAFRAALALGATHIESDIQVTKDGEPVLFHDDDLLRVAGLPRKIKHLTLSELSKIELIDGGRIPTLREAFTALPAARFNLDLKVWEALRPTVELIRELDVEGRVLLTSFSDKRRGQAVAALGGRVVSSAGTGRVLGLWLASKFRMHRLIKRLAKPVQALQVPVGKGPIRFDSPAFMTQMTEVGLELHYWTINEPSEMLMLISLGAQGIVTDRTDLAVKTIRTAS